MIGLVRAAAVCAIMALGLVSAGSAAVAADKAFKRDDLADAAIKLEAQIKSEAGAVNKPLATLRTDADAALRRNDLRTGLQILGQIATAALFPVVEEATGAAFGADLERLGTAAPVLDLLSMRHETQYTRLFRS